MALARRLLTAALATIPLMGSPSVAAAATSGEQAMRILTSPPRVLASVTPGATSTTSVLVVHQSRSSVSLLVRAADLAPDPDGASFGILSDVGDAPRGAGRWLTVDRPTLALGPGEQATVRVTIRVPPDADAGGHYGAIVVETTPNADGSSSEREEVELRVRLATHVNVLVPGDVEYAASISDFRTSRRADGRIDVRGTFENDGNIQTTPQDVRLRVAGPTGDRTVELEIPETMPGGTRTIRERVRVPSPAGRFTSHVSLQLEDGSQVRSRRSTVVAWLPWVPWSAGGTLAALLVALIGIPWYRRHRELQRYIRLELAELEAERSSNSSDVIDHDS